MTSLRSVPHFAISLFTALTVMVSVATSAPPPAISGLIGEWIGETGHTAAGEPVLGRFADARRYWADGDSIRGEFLVGSGNSLQTVQVAIVPRDRHYLKILTSENGRRELLVGIAADSGVLWSPLAGDQNRFIERVAGEGADRRLEFVVPEGDPANLVWRTTEILKPAKAALSGVIGGGVAEVGVILPLELPSEAELALVARVAALLVQRDAARADTANLARELASAWRESENAGARAKALEAGVAELQTKLTTAIAPKASDEMTARVSAAEKDAQEARRWADELEKSLRGANTKMEENAARIESLARDSGAAQENARRLGAERDALAAQLATRTQELATRASRITELEAGAAEAQRVATAAASETSRGVEAQAALDAAQIELARVQAAQIAAAREADGLRTEKTALDQRLAEVGAQLAAAEARRADVETSLTTTAARLETAELERQKLATQLAAAGADSRLADLEQKLATVTGTAAQREQVLVAATADRDTQRARAAELETRLAAAQADLDAAGKKTQELTARLAAASAPDPNTKVIEAKLATAIAQGDAQRARVAELEALVAAGQVEANRAAEMATRLAALERDLGAQREQLTTVSAQREQLETRLAGAVGERDAAREKVAAVEAQMAAWVQEAPAAAEDASEQVAALEKDLAVVRGELTSATTARGELEKQLRSATETQTRLNAELATARRAQADERDRAAALEAQSTAVRNQPAPAAASTARLTGLETELAAARAENALAATRRAELERELAAANESAESVARAGRQSDGDLSAARARVAELETVLVTERGRNARLERDLQSTVGRAETAPAVDARVADLEERLAATFARAQQRQDEIDRLTARLRDRDAAPANAGANPTVAASGPRFSLTPPAPTPAVDEAAEARRRQAENESAQRNRELVEQARAAEARVAAAVPPAAPQSRSPVPAVADDSSGGAPVSFRLSPEPERPAARSGGAVRVAPTRPTGDGVFVIPEGVVGNDAGLTGAVRGLAISGYRRAGPNSVVIISGRSFRPGEVVDVRRGLRLLRIDPEAIVFSGPAGAEYRFPL